MKGYVIWGAEGLTPQEAAEARATLAADSKTFRRQVGKWDTDVVPVAVPLVLKSRKRRHNTG